MQDTKLFMKLKSSPFNNGIRAQPYKLYTPQMKSS